MTASATTTTTTLQRRPVTTLSFYTYVAVWVERVDTIHNFISPLLFITSRNIDRFSSFFSAVNLWLNYYQKDRHRMSVCCDFFRTAPAHLHSTPRWGGDGRNFAIIFCGNISNIKLKGWGYQNVNIFEDLFSRFDTLDVEVYCDLEI